jgi:hypothetical protein
MGMKYIFYLITFFCLLAGTHALAQSPIPEPPVMYYVTVDPESGHDIIVWTSSPSDFTDYYAVCITQITNPITHAVDYVDLQPYVYVPNTTFINPNTESYSGPVGYAVGAINDLGGGPTTLFPGPLSLTDSTIFLESVYDSCQATITLTWNDYNSWRGSIAEYNIKRRLGPGIYQEIGKVAEGTNTYLIQDIQVNQVYDLFVEAVHNDGIRRSTSNRNTLTSGISHLPGFINADYATIGSGNTIDLSFTIDGSSTLSRFFLMRSEDQSGPFTQVTEINTSDKRIYYTDIISFTSSTYYYRLDVFNNCNTIAAGSNLANNIILDGSLVNMNVALNWNEYVDWNGGVDRYSVIRRQGRDNQLADTLDVGNNTSFADDLTNFINYENPGLICYEVLATENINTYGIQGKSLSNRICFSVMPDIRIPNAFIPNDTEPMNQVFEPVFSMLPEHYKMIIYNRLGTKIWEGSQAWDGRVNDKYVPEGVYLYYIKVFNYSTEVTELNGKVTVVYR